MNSWMRVLENIVWLTQLGLSMLLPPVGCLWVCSWLVNSKGAPMWLYLVFLVLGLVAGGQGFYHFYRMMMRKAEKEKTNRRGYNRHS